MKLGHARPEPVALGTMIASYGRSDPISNGGGRIFCTSHGSYFEYTDGQLYDDGVLYIWGTLLSNDVAYQFRHTIGHHLEAIAETAGLSIEQWSRCARGTLKQRASCICNIAEFFDWSTIDDEPLRLSPTDLRVRWYSAFEGEGAIIHEGATAAWQAAEFIIALNSVDPARGDELFPALFPLIPSEALSNPESSWWTNHGPAALHKLRETLKDVCPAGFVFEIRDGFYGFWSKSEE